MSSCMKTLVIISAINANNNQTIYSYRLFLLQIYSLQFSLHLMSKLHLSIQLLIGWSRQSQDLIMLLGRRLKRLFCDKNNSMKDTFIKRGGRLFYDIPPHPPAQKFNFKINEEVPKDAKDFPLQNISINNLEDTPEFDNIPKLQHGLNKLLDGKIYEGDMGFGTISQVKKQVVSQMSVYKPPSQDTKLIKITKEASCKFTSSTSNISVPMMHLYFLFSMFRRPNFDNIYEDNDTSLRREYMNHFKKPSTFFLTRMKNDEGTAYSIDSDKGYTEEKVNEVLLQVGTLSEYLLTHSQQTINQIIETGLVPQKQQNYYRYCIVNKNLFLRSQIDCRDIDENGNPYVFQIKTRACCPIRYDVQNWKKYKDYPIDKLRGNFQSFEREYYDLIRGAFIKYAFQLKIGKMGGAFIAYHNTESIYGYEYVNFKEIILRLFGDQYNLDLSFGIISKMMTQIFEQILEDTKQYDYRQLKIGFYANSVTKSLNVIVQVMSEMKQYPITNSWQSVQLYFEKHIKQLKNPVFKYDFSFFTYLNGILVRHPQIYYTPSDNIKMKWKVRKLGRIQKEEYMQFLREAYKEDFIFGSHRYYGAWPQVDNIKEWN